MIMRTQTERHTKSREKRKTKGRLLWCDKLNETLVLGFARDNGVHDMFPSVTLRWQPHAAASTSGPCRPSTPPALLPLARLAQPGTSPQRHRRPCRTAGGVWEIIRAGRAPAGAGGAAAARGGRGEEPEGGGRAGAGPQLCRSARRGDRALSDDRSPEGRLATSAAGAAAPGHAEPAFRHHSMRAAIPLEARVWRSWQKDVGAVTDSVLAALEAASCRKWQGGDAAVQAGFSTATVLCIHAWASCDRICTNWDGVHPQGRQHTV